MSWVSQTLNSTLGRKIIMSLTGLFLITFLIIHTSGNFQLLKGDGGDAFNMYTKFMTTNPLIKTVSYLLYTTFIVHILWSIILTVQNRKARPEQYAYKNASGSTWASRNMGLLGTIIFVFLVLHLRGFWYELKFGDVPTTTIDGEQYKDLYSVVVAAFNEWYISAIYVVAMVFLGFHLRHGFWSAFQTLGLDHKKYTPIIKGLGLVIAIAIPLSFAIQPIYIYFFVPAGG